MTIKKLIEVLKLAKDIDIADVTFYVGEKPYEIKDMSQGNLLTDVSIELEEVEIPLIQPAKFKRDKQKMVKETVKRITKKSSGILRTPISTSSQIGKRYKK